MAVQDHQGDYNLPEDPWDWEEISFDLLLNSNLYQDLGSEKSPVWGRKKHRLRWLGKPRAIPQVILKLQEPKFRESSLHLLSSYLFEKRDEDPENYYRTGLLLYYSCSTMAILIQEVLFVYRVMAEGSLSERACMRLINVIILFQCIAANKETRKKFMKSCMANLLVPLVLFESPLEVYDNVRALALSVFGILCQAGGSDAIRWAIETDMVEVCLICMETGNELTKVIGLHIVEAIIQDKSGMSYLLRPRSDHLLIRLIRTWQKLFHLSNVPFLKANQMAVPEDFSPRLLFHTVRCYTLLCNDERGYDLVEQSLPESFTSDACHEILEKFHVIRRLIWQLLLIAGRNKS